VLSPIAEGACLPGFRIWHRRAHEVRAGGGEQPVAAGADDRAVGEADAAGLPRIALVMAASSSSGAWGPAACCELSSARIAVAGQVAQAAGAEDQRGGASMTAPLPPVSATSQSVMVAAAAPARCTPDPVTRVMVVSVSSAVADWPRATPVPATSSIRQPDRRIREVAAGLHGRAAARDGCGSSRSPPRPIRPARAGRRRHRSHARPARRQRSSPLRRAAVPRGSPVRALVAAPARTSRAASRGRRARRPPPAVVRDDGHIPVEGHASGYTPGDIVTTPPSANPPGPPSRWCDGCPSRAPRPAAAGRPLRLPIRPGRRLPVPVIGPGRACGLRRRGGRAPPGVPGRAHLTPRSGCRGCRRGGRGRWLSGSARPCADLSLPRMRLA